MQTIQNFTNLTKVIEYFMKKIQVCNGKVLHTTCIKNIIYLFPNSCVMNDGQETTISSTMRTKINVAVASDNVLIENIVLCNSIILFFHPVYAGIMKYEIHQEICSEYPKNHHMYSINVSAVLFPTSNKLALIKNTSQA